jgi:hypothetical protein
MIPSNSAQREKMAYSLSLADIFFANIVSACLLFLNQDISYHDLLSLISSFSVEFEKLGLLNEDINSILSPMAIFPETNLE